ncbi:MAG: hypothetical protein IPK73_19285 [Candidatus Obscuribacter sp.]|nr:hypothetical protein [Candidatus Obscuribacter sp.]MBK9278221.1 hypothetical protein [Candidatus Obscuribacter sp.]
MQVSPSSPVRLFNLDHGTKISMMPTTTGTSSTIRKAVKDKKESKA